MISRYHIGACVSSGSCSRPTETHISRKAISAGCLPVSFCSTTENALLENALKTDLGLTVKFKVTQQSAI